MLPSLERYFNLALSHQFNQQQTADPAYRKFQRILLAICIILAPLALSSWFVLCPQYGVSRCPDTTGASLLAAFRAVNPLLMQWFFFVTLVVAYLYPFSYLGLGLVAMKRSPWLATLGIALGMIGSFPWTLIVNQVILINAIAHMGGSALPLTLLNQANSTWPITVLFLGWVIGHLLGYVLLGIALGRAGAIPSWVASLFIGGAFFQAISYPTHLGALQVFGFVLVFTGSIPAALAMLKGRGEPGTTGIPTIKEVNSK